MIQGSDVPFSIKTINESNSIDAQGNVQDVYVVTWTIPGLGTYTTNVPKSEFNAQSVQELIQQHANELGGLVMNVDATHNNGE